jgi:hypothetical protein
MKQIAKLNHLFLHKGVFIFLFVILLMVTSCFRDPVNVDLSEFGTHVVIQGTIADNAGPHFIRITETIPYNGNHDFPAVSGANVSIQDDQGNTVKLQETESGLYQAFNFQGIPGRLYTLTAIIKGKKYTASSGMPKPLQIKNVNMERTSPGVNDYELSLIFQDRAGIEDFCAGIEDFCLINVYKNGILHDHYLYQDEQTDGQEVIFDDLNVSFNNNDVATFELISFDRASYDFFSSLDMVVDVEDRELLATFIPITTYNPTTNLNNGAFGYFSAFAIRRYTRIVN